MRLKDRLIAILDELSESEFKRFKHKLNDMEIHGGFSRIPKGKLEKADVLDLVDLLISYYTEEYAKEVTVNVLNQINKRDLAAQLA
ncbi:apoptosis-associated speck-like protein containing a CARD [Latimeria chalumnae]|uniref:apoptosis-associated speck-like protein containing a CARD n=1 Tax=Latimeria chalumnae TaxID=7897 RepID=UPI0003C101E9|nr:PREDICTED: apoptosis-associated speck-like protein containing a CARD [Latimeria chalumnae]|eukprot:XP_006014531.1 PREDICTED: apoptosis-associated speck-like protein containing a CARD [Latimeria chalumnae]